MFTALAENFGTLRSQINLFVACSPILFQNSYEKFSEEKWVQGDYNKQEEELMSFSTAVKYFKINEVFNSDHYSNGRYDKDTTKFKLLFQYLCKDLFS